MKSMIISVTSIILGLQATTSFALVARDNRISQRHVAPYSYLGCYTEGTGVRALSAFTSVNQSTMTVGVCAGLCIPTYTLFGLEYGGECWCANVFSTGSVLAPETECFFPCAGNASEICGAGNRLNVYSTTAAPPSAPVHVLTAGSYTRIGCYTEGNSTRALSEAHYINYTSQTVEKCAKFCEAGSYAVMGVEYGGECYCGSEASFATSQAILAPDADCNMSCAGAPGEFCGAGNRLDTYQITADPHETG